MIETINGKAYLKVGDKVYELGGGSNIITADSVEQLPDPASVPEGTIAFVPSEGGGGLPVVEIVSPISFEKSTLSEAENISLDAASASKKPATIIINIFGMVLSVVYAYQETTDYVRYEFYGFSGESKVMQGFIFEKTFETGYWQMWMSTTALS